MRVLTADRSLDEKLRIFCRTRDDTDTELLYLSREPSFFDALSVEGSRNDVIAVMNGDTITGIAVRSEKRCLLVNGTGSFKAGYLGSLRLGKGIRRGLGLFRGFELLRALDEQSDCLFYLTTIFESNEEAHRMLTSSRAGLPRYEPLGRLFTLAVLPSTVGSCEVHSGVAIRRAHSNELDRIVSFLNSEFPSRAFFPQYSREDFGPAGRLLRELNAEDIFVALDGDQIIGLMGAWNQSPYRCWKPVDSRAGEFKYRFLSIVRVKGDNPEVFSALLSRLSEKVASTGSETAIVATFHEQDSFLPLVAPFAVNTASSLLFGVSWRELDFSTLLTGAVPYIEAGSL